MGRSLKVGLSVQIRNPTWLFSTSHQFPFSLPIPQKLFRTAAGNWYKGNALILDDLTPSSLVSIGGRVGFESIAMQCSSPLFEGIANCNAVLFFGNPGVPTSSARIPTGIRTDQLIQRLSSATNKRDGRWFVEKQNSNNLQDLHLFN